MPKLLRPCDVVPIVGPAVGELRTEITVRGGNVAGTTDLQLGRILTACGGDTDLAATACVMKPRPGWVESFLFR